MNIVTRARIFELSLFFFSLDLLIVLFSLMIGAVPLGAGFYTLVQEAMNFLQGKELSFSGTILFKVRLPRILLAGVAGAGLSTAGASFQALFRNPLADPYILGISSGGALGAIIALVLGVGSGALGGFILALFAFLGALSTIFLVFSIARTKGRLPSHTLLLAGVIINAFFSAIIMFLITIARREDVHNIVFWMMGNLSYASYRGVFWTGLFVVSGAITLFGLARDFNLLSLGEESASELGVDVERTKRIAFFAGSFATGAVVSVTGLIGFVGLIVPHIIRLVFGPDHRILILCSFFLGAGFLILSDGFARTIIAPAELPVGVITALLGGPFFIWLLKTGKSMMRS